MKRINYIDTNSLLKSKEEISVNSSKLDIIRLYGTVYRGESKFRTTLSDTPAFFGVKSAADIYVLEDEFLKYYLTKKPLQILVLSNSTPNKVRKFFKDMMEDPKYKNDIKPCVVYIFLQIFYGQIDGKYNNLDTCGLTFDQIKNYFFDQYKKYKIKQPTEMSLKYLHKLLIEYPQDENLEPSRVSLESFDKFTTKQLKELLKNYNIDGLTFISYKKSTHDKLCRTVNEEVKKDGLHGDSCVPDDITIFNPRESLKFFKVEKNVDGKYVDIPLNFHRDQYRNKSRSKSRRFYRTQYNKYKKRYNYLKNLN